MMLNAIGTEVTQRPCVYYCSWVGFDKVHYLCYTERPSARDQVVKGGELASQTVAATWSQGRRPYECVHSQRVVNFIVFGSLSTLLTHGHSIVFASVFHS